MGARFNCPWSTELQAGKEKHIAGAQNTRSLLLGIWGHLSRRRRIQLGLLLLVMLASGAAELVSLGAVLPFLAVLSDPDRLWQMPLVRETALWVGIDQAAALLLPAAALFAVAAVLAAAVRLLNLWLNGRLAALIGSDLSCEAYTRTLYQPYGVHVARNSSRVINAATAQIQQTVAALNAVLQLITSCVVAIGLLSALLVIDWQVACLAAGVFGAAYGLLMLTTSRRLASNSRRVADTSQQQLKALQEGLGAIRDVLLDGTQATYQTIYRKADLPMRLTQAQNGFLGVFPRYGLEALGLVLIATLALLLDWQEGNGKAVLPILGTLALGAQRLLPALQQMYAGWANLRSLNAAISGVLEMLNQPIPANVSMAVEPLQLQQCIGLEHLCFGYKPHHPMVLHDINLKITRGERIGIIGRTGSGKSTLVDLLMGLLDPSSGRIWIDGDDLHDPQQPHRVLQWRAAIAHVPQSIYLADSSIAENIAFGIPRHQIDLERVRRAAEQAQIASFIESSDAGYDTFVGERGIRLSGGQRQRIGIARALYKQASVLVFDEATSALDNTTEQAVIQAIEGLSRDLTLVMIAHRLSTVQGCDRVIELSAGGVKREFTGLQVI
jgi:ABC-type multidrug transport system fused ATPase/permease subunit